MATQNSPNNRAAEARALACRILTQSIKSKTSLDIVIHQSQQELNHLGQEGFIKDICYGVVRWYPRLQAILKILLDKPVRSKDREVEILALCGLYQLEYQNTANHAAVAETVSACDVLSRNWAKGLINAVLRRFLREREDILEELAQIPSAEYSHPHWLIEKIREDWPDNAEQILQANNQHPPMCLRLNLEQMNRDSYLAELAHQGIVAKAHELIDSAIILGEPIQVHALPGFDQGWVSVQDAAAQIAADLLDAGAGQRVLDACAAPGGKTGHILERQKELSELHALDVKKNRLQRIAENLERLKLNANLICADASQPEQWWDRRPYDRILLDVPCSACGVIRRNPDIKIVRTQKDIDDISQLQFRIISNIWPLLASGGKLVYCSCSIFRQENDKVIHRFNEETNDVQIHKITAEWGIETDYGRQILPGQHDMDGFFYALLEKQ